MNSRISMQHCYVSLFDYSWLIPISLSYRIRDIAISWAVRYWYQWQMFRAIAPGREAG